MAHELSENTRALVRSQIPDYYSLSPEDQALAAIKVIAQDFYIYCERNLMIRNKQGTIIPLVLNWAQRLLAEAVIADIQAGIPVRYIILKARQMGLSTVVEALCFWWTTTHRNVTSIIMAHDAAASQNLYEMFRRYYEHSHPHFQPTLKYNTRHDLVFDIEDSEKQQLREQGITKMPGLASQIKTMVAKEGRGKSFTGSFFHGSEVSAWEDTADVVSGVLQAIPLEANTFEFLESTANGLGGYYYSEYQAAKRGKSVFKAIFFPWHMHDGYELDGTITDYDEEEQDLLEIFARAKYPAENWDRKIVWRRAKMKEYSSDIKKFYQDYPKDDMEAFLSTGRPRFDTKILVKMENYAIDNPSHIFGAVSPNIDPSNSQKYIFHEVPITQRGQDPTPLKVWELPEKNINYSIGVDVSEGKLAKSGEDGSNDYSVIDVMRTDTLKTVARWRGHIDPDLLGEVVYAIGTYYNNALVGVEVNNHGLATIQSLRNKFYRNLYMRETSEEHQFQERTAVMGWQTNRKTKPLMIDNLATAIREGAILDLDSVFINECMTYVVDDQGHTNAQLDTFDDTVMAKAINLQMAQFSTVNQTYAREHISKPIKRHSDRHSSTFDADANGWTRKPRSTDSRGAVERRKLQRAKHRARV